MSRPKSETAEADFIGLLAERMAEIQLLRADLDQTDKMLAARHVEFAAIKASDTSWNGGHPMPEPLAARIDAYFDATNKIYLRSAALQDLIAELERRGREPDDQASKSPCSDYPRSPLVGPHLDEAIEEVVIQRVRARLGAQPGDPL